MTNLLAGIRRRLSAKILIVLTVCVAAVMAMVIFLAVANQHHHLLEQMTASGHKLQSLAYAAIKHPMAMGDSAAVEQQLLTIRDQMEGTQIIVCDFNQRIVFSSHGELLGKSMADLTGSLEFLAALQKMLEASEQEPAPGHFEEVRDSHSYLLTLDAIVNKPECFSCHAPSRLVLGGMITRFGTDSTYAAIATLRDRTITISLLGIAAIVLLTYLLLARLVTRPVEELAEKSRRIAAGDLDVTVTVTSEDAVGHLGRAFNSMAKSVKDQIGYFNSLRDAIAAPLFIVDTGLIITYMNEACEKLTGFRKEEVEGKLSCRQVFPSDRCEKVCPVLAGLDNAAPIQGAATLINRQGERIPVVISSSLLKDAHGTVIGAVEICKDVSDVIEAERFRYLQETAAREEEQRRSLEERAAGLLAVLSRVSAGDLKVRTEEQGRGDELDQIARHINLSLDNLEDLYDRLSSFSKEMEREVERRTTMLREKTVLLERANRELRELDRLKSDFLANMSHELRTPMNSIIGYTDLLLDRVDGDINDEQENSLNKVRHNARHLLQLINDILDMAKIESGKIALDPAFIDIRSLTGSVATIFEPTIAKKGLSLTLDLAEELPLVYADEDKVRQIFINLLSNATKFTGQGSITIRIRPLAQADPGAAAPQFVEVCVTDTGIGIRPTDLDRLFDKFSQIDSSTVRLYEGTGLGLSIARGLVVLHKGKIWATSIPGKGSTFCFTLPARKELLDKPARTVIEPGISEVMSQYFELPAATFLKIPLYNGRPVKCWEFAHCGQSSCPAYGSEERRCWLIPGTHCRGTKIAECSEKVDFCKGCEIIEMLLLAETEPQFPGPDSGSDRSPVPLATDRRTVLVIDDNPEVVELVSKYIGDEYRVVGLLGGETAVAMAIELRPAVITLDIMMPGKDGWQVLYELKQNQATQDIPVLILSIVDNRKLGFSLGAAEYIVKPVDRNLLLRKLRSLEKIASIRNILVVDNDAHTVAILREHLEAEGYETAGAGSSGEVGAALRKTVPDLIVLNPVMAETSGPGVMEQLKATRETRGIPLILLTQQNLSQKELENLNGHIQAVLHRNMLSEEALREELLETIRKCNRAMPQKSVGK